MGRTTPRSRSAALSARARQLTPQAAERGEARAHKPGRWPCAVRPRCRTRRAARGIRCCSLAAADASAAKRTVRASAANDGSSKSEVVRRLNGDPRVAGPRGRCAPTTTSTTPQTRTRAAWSPPALFSHDSASGTPLRRPHPPLRQGSDRRGDDRLARRHAGVAAGAAHGRPLDELAAAPPDAHDARLQADRRLPQGREDVRPSGRGLHGRPGRLEPLRPLRRARPCPAGARARAGRPR